MLGLAYCSSMAYPNFLINIDLYWPFKAGAYSVWQKSVWPTIWLQSAVQGF